MLMLALSGTGPHNEFTRTTTSQSPVPSTQHLQEIPKLKNFMSRIETKQLLCRFVGILLCQYVS